MQLPQLETDCVVCGQWIVFPYHRLGRRLPCPTCGQALVLDVLGGARPPEREDFLTFREFEHLLAYAPHRARVAPLLQEWFGYEVDLRFGGAVALTGRKGEPLELAQVHEAIQKDREQRAELHRLAHSLWR